MAQYSLYDALYLWRNFSASKKVRSRIDKNLSIALRLYVLPELLSIKERIEVEQLDQYSAQLPLTKFEEPLSVFERSFQSAVEAGITAKSTGKNYRAALRLFWTWLLKQPCWICSQPDPIRIAPSASKRPSPPGARQSKVPYGLREELYPSQILLEIREFREFRLNGVAFNNRRLGVRSRLREDGRRKPKIVAVGESTFDRDKSQISEFFGWYTLTHILSKIPAQELDYVIGFFKSENWLSVLINYRFFLFSDAALRSMLLVKDALLCDLHLDLMIDAALVDDFVFDVVENREVCYSTGVNLLKTAIAVAKWLNYEKTNSRNWHDVPIIHDLKNLRNEYAEYYKVEKEELDREKSARKKLTHDEARQIVDYLRVLCAPRRPSLDMKTRTKRYSQKRPISAVARAWQTYLIVKILVYCPVRQEEIRNLEMGKTLFRKEDKQGNAFYEVLLTKHKRDASGKPRHYRLPKILTKDLDIWLFKWKPIIDDALQSNENWLRFWGYPLDKAERCRQKLQDARNGILSSRAKKSADEYIAGLEYRLKGIERRVAAWEIAKKNYLSHECIFFMFGKKDTEAFGRPHNVSTIWQTVRRAVAIATKDLFGEPRWTNPQVFRNIGEQHVRRPERKRSGLADSFGKLIGHSKEMGDEYANKITSEYEIIEEIVNNWWHKEA